MKKNESPRAIDLEYDTSINKKMFQIALCKKFNDMPNINCYYSAKDGILTIHDTKSKEVVSAPFYQYISGASRFDVTYEENNSDYALKEKTFPDSSLKFQFIILEGYKIRLSDAIKDATGFENKIKMDFENLFDSNLLIERKKSSTKDFEETDYRTRYRSTKNKSFNSIYQNFIQFKPNPDKNPFDCLDRIAKYCAASMYIYYPKYNYHDFNNGTYEGYLKLIPKLVLYDEAKQQVLYEGDSIKKLTGKLLDKFSYDMKTKPEVKKDFTKATTVNTSFEKMVLLDYLSEQIDEIKRYLDIRETIDETDLKRPVGEAKRTLYQAYEEISNRRIVVKNEDIIFDMIDRFDEIREEVGYFKDEIMKKVIKEFSDKKSDHELKDKIGIDKSDTKPIELNLDEEMSYDDMDYDESGYDDMEMNY